MDHVREGYERVRLFIRNQSGSYKDMLVRYVLLAINGYDCNLQKSFDCARANRDGIIDVIQMATKRFRQARVHMSAAGIGLKLGR